jgi:hypothetical protein
MDTKRYVAWRNNMFKTANGKKISHEVTGSMVTVLQEACVCMCVPQLELARKCQQSGE